MNLGFIYLLGALVVGTFFYLRWKGKNNDDAFLALAAFYFFVYAGIPWYHIRTAQMKFSEVNQWFFLTAMILGLSHLIFRRQAKKIYFWLAVITIVGSVIFLIMRQYGYPYFFPI
jgi:hypothetical protein